MKYRLTARAKTVRWIFAALVGCDLFVSYRATPDEISVRIGCIFAFLCLCIAALAYEAVNLLVSPGFEGVRSPRIARYIGAPLLAGLAAFGTNWLIEFTQDVGEVHREGLSRRTYRVANAYSSYRSLGLLQNLDVRDVPDKKYGWDRNSVTLFF